MAGFRRMGGFQFIFRLVDCTAAPVADSGNSEMRRKSIKTLAGF